MAVSGAALREVTLKVVLWQRSKKETEKGGNEVGRDAGDDDGG